MIIENAEAEHLRHIIAMLIDKQPPSWNVWAVNMEVDGWEMLPPGEWWHDDGRVLTFEQAAKYFADGDTP